MGASFLFAAILFQTTPAVPNEDLQRGKNAFDRGEFARAVEIVRPLLYPDIHLQSDAQIVLAHRILGVSYLFEKDQPEATREFRKLLQLIPDYRFDPLLDPPEVVDFFNNVRKGYEAELSELEARRKAMEQARLRDKETCEKVLAGPTVIERRVGRNSFMVNFIPFGAGQFQNGHRQEGLGLPRQRIRAWRCFRRRLRHKPGRLWVAPTADLPLRHRKRGLSGGPDRPHRGEPITLAHPCPGR